MTHLARLLPILQRPAIRTFASHPALRTRPICALTAPTLIPLCKFFSTSTSLLYSTASPNPPLPLPTLTISDRSVQLHWSDISASTHHHLWLRDNCLCPACIHPTTHQKLHSSADVDPSVRPLHPPRLTADGLEVVWDRPLLRPLAGPSSTSPSSEPHTSLYPFSFLRTHAHRAGRVSSRYDDLRPVTWTSDQIQRDVLWIDHDEFMDSQDTRVLYRACRALFDHGLVFIRGVPVKEDGSATTAVAERIGPIRNTFYGRSWDVRNVPKARNVAYTNMYLGFHMDLLYMDYPPGLQFLHCLRNNVVGGASIFVDSFRAAELLRLRHPDDYTTLTRVPVTFHYDNDGHYMHRRRPTIVEDPYDEGPAWAAHINYSPPFQGPLEIEDPKEVEKWYSAFRKFAEIVEDEGLRYQMTLAEGECVIFANRRVLHGRTEFDPSSGHRHLKGTYVDLDAFKDRLRILSKEHAED